MQVKGKIFPYPVINRNKSFSNYPSKDFMIKFDKSDDAQTCVLNNCKFETNSEYINELFKKEKIGISLIIECSDTIYRKAFDISDCPQNIKLNKVDFNEKVDISMYAYAKEKFYMKSAEFDEDYKDIVFDIEKYDIIGIDDGFYVNFIHEDYDDNLVQSIFSIIVSEDLDEGAYQVDCDLGKKIAITLSRKDYNNYGIIYTVPIYKEVFFNMILVPSLIEGLSLCKRILDDESKDLDDVGNQYPWFRTIIFAYKKIKGEDIEIQDFKKVSSVSLAQYLLGKPLGQALQKLVADINKPADGGSDNE